MLVKTPRARRLVLLYRLRMAGVLEKLTLRQIGTILGVRRSALLKDLQELDEAEVEFQQMMDAEPWKEYIPAVDSTLVAEDEEIKALKRLMRDGLIWLENWVTVDTANGH